MCDTQKERWNVDHEKKKGTKRQINSLQASCFTSNFRSLELGLKKYLIAFKYSFAQEEERGLVSWSGKVFLLSFYSYLMVKRIVLFDFCIKHNCRVWGSKCHHFSFPMSKIQRCIRDAAVLGWLKLFRKKIVKLSYLSI